MKSTKATIQQRVEEVLAIRLAGAEFADIRQYAAEKQWNVSERQLWRYIEATDELCKATVGKDREKTIARHIAQRHALYARCMSVSDYGTALRVLQDEAALLNLYPPKQTQLTGKDSGPVVLEIKEELVGDFPATLANIANIIEEVVSNDRDHSPAIPENQASPGPAGLPQV